MKNALSIVLLVMVSYLTFSTINASKERQRIVADSTEINHIKYGLLSVHAWKDKVSEILTKKIREFQITSNNRREIGRSIDNAMYALIREFEYILEDNRSNGNWFTNAFASLFQSFVFDVNDLKRRIPEFREIILDEIDNYETREKLRRYIQNRVEQLLYQTVGDEDLSRVHDIIEAYDLGGYENRGYLQSMIQEDVDPPIKRNVLLIVLLSAAIFVVNLYRQSTLSKPTFYILCATTLVLLLGGVLMPMLEIEARIDSFGFALMGEPLGFDNQILFYQGKSILDVVQILLGHGDYQSIIVGFLILLFSVIFPVSKLLSSTYLFEKDNSDNKLLSFLAYKSGKWSMADVFVVAIFMAFIGFQGIIKNQLNQLEGIGSNVDVIATDHSQFGFGFLLFLAFCILSMILSHMCTNQTNT